MAEWTQKYHPAICCPQETHFRFRDISKLKIKEFKKIYHANNTPKRAGVAILILDKEDFKAKLLLQTKTTCYNDKKVNYQEHIIIINICVANSCAPKYKKSHLTSSHTHQTRQLSTKGRTEKKG